MPFLKPDPSKNMAEIFSHSHFYNHPTSTLEKKYVPLTLLNLTMGQLQNALLLSPMGAEQETVEEIIL